jgi:hypothetical protein
MAWLIDGGAFVEGREPRYRAERDQQEAAGAERGCGSSGSGHQHWQLYRAAVGAPHKGWLRRETFRRPFVRIV